MYRFLATRWTHPICGVRGGGGTCKPRIWKAVKTYAAAGSVRSERSEPWPSIGKQTLNPSERWEDGIRKKCDYRGVWTNARLAYLGRDWSAAAGPAVFLDTCFKTFLESTRAVSTTAFGPVALAVVTTCTSSDTLYSVRFFLSVRFLPGPIVMLRTVVLRNANRRATDNTCRRVFFVFTWKRRPYDAKCTHGIPTSDRVHGNAITAPTGTADVGRRHGPPTEITPRRGTHVLYS